MTMAARSITRRETLKTEDQGTVAILRRHGRRSPSPASSPQPLGHEIAGFSKPLFLSLSLSSQFSLYYYTIEGLDNDCFKPNIPSPPPPPPPPPPRVPMRALWSPRSTSLAPDSNNTLQAKLTCFPLLNTPWVGGAHEYDIHQDSRSSLTVCSIFFPWLSPTPNAIMS